MTIERKRRRGKGGNEPSSVVINGLNWISVERLIGDCRPPEDGVEQNYEQNCLGLERVGDLPHTVGVRVMWPRSSGKKGMRAEDVQRE